jgi:hypothetical protein
LAYKWCREPDLDGGMKTLDIWNLFPSSQLLTVVT